MINLKFVAEIVKYLEKQQMTLVDSIQNSFTSAVQWGILEPIKQLLQTKLDNVLSKN